MYFTITGEVKLYPYRTALVRDVFLELPRNLQEMRDFEGELAVAAHGVMNNHTVYRIQHDGNTIYVRCSDTTVSFAWTIEERSY